MKNWEKLQLEQKLPWKFQGAREEEKGKTKLAVKIRGSRRGVFICIAKFLRDLCGIAGRRKRGRGIEAGSFLSGKGGSVHRPLGSNDV